MRPADGIASGEGNWCLASPSGDCLVYTEHREDTLTVKLPTAHAAYQPLWIDARTGEINAGEEIAVDEPVRLQPKSNVAWLRPAEKL
jgi:hypothetical protein